MDPKRPQDPIRDSVCQDFAVPTWSSSSFLQHFLSILRAPCERRKFRSQTSDDMDRWKAEQGRGREKRKIRRKKGRRERVTRKKMQMRKVATHCVFQWFGAPEGRKVGSLKRRVRSQLARWEMKNCTPLWHEAHFEVKMYKTHHSWTTFGSWDVGKVHALVARSKFRSEHVQTTPGADHFWKLRCRKSARPCGAKHISKWTCTNYTRCGPLLEIEMSRKCTPLWREAHFEVNMYKTHQVRTTFGSWDVEKVHALVARSTFRSEHVQNTRGFGPLLEVQTSKKCTHLWREAHFEVKMLKTQGVSDHFWRFRCRFASLHYTKLHSTTLHYTQLHYTTLHYITLHYTTFHYTSLHYTTLHYITLHHTPLHYNYNYNYTTTLHYTPLRSTTLHYTPLHFTTLHYTTLHYATLHYTSLHYATLNSTTLQIQLHNYTPLHSTRLHYTKLHYITLHCTTLHYTTLHYTTLHSTTLQLQLHNYTPLHSTTLHYTPLHSTTLNYTTLHYTTLHYTALNYTTLHYTFFHYTSLHYSALHSTTLQLQLQLHSTTLHYTQLHYTTLHYTTLHYTTLNYTTFHYTPLH